jgi:hypothetical protein
MALGVGFVVTIGVLIGVVAVAVSKSGVLGPSIGVGEVRGVGV